jgi:hypothetical protein
MKDQHRHKIQFSITPAEENQHSCRLMAKSARAKSKTDLKMMEAVSTSETSVDFYQTTRRNIPKDSHFHIRRRKSMSTKRDLRKED